MRTHLGLIALTLGLWTGTGCEPAKQPKATPMPPPLVAVEPAPPPALPAPAAKVEPPTLPPELIAKVDEVLKLARQPAPTAADPLDQAVAAAEQQAKVLTLATEIPALVEKLSAEQKAEFERRYREQLSALLKVPAVPAPDAPPAKP